MRVHLVNPSEVSFGTAVITPRWLYVLAAATPVSFGDPCLVDETLEAVKPLDIQGGDVVGIGIHTANALRGYEIGKMARERGAYVVFGGIPATLYPAEAHELGGAHAVVKGDGDVVWGKVLSDCGRGTPQLIYEGGRIEASEFLPARWDLVPRKSYMWASVQTVRGCPKHCPSARFGGRMGSVPGSGPRTLWFKRSCNCDSSGFASLRSPPTTSIP